MLNLWEGNYTQTFPLTWSTIYHMDNNFIIVILNLILINCNLMVIPGMQGLSDVKLKDVKHCNSDVTWSTGTFHFADTLTYNFTMY